MRIDLNEASVQTIYVTIWTSPNISLHLGKTENADEISSKHVGLRLQVMFLMTCDILFYIIDVKQSSYLGVICSLRLFCSFP